MHGGCYYFRGRFVLELFYVSSNDDGGNVIHVALAIETSTVSVGIGRRY